MKKKGACSSPISNLLTHLFKSNDKKGKNIYPQNVLLNFNDIFFVPVDHIAKRGPFRQWALVTRVKDLNLRKHFKYILSGIK
jgi:hypothetical protein